MIIIWKGAGILVPLVGGAVIWAMSSVIGSVFGPEYFANHFWCAPLTGIVSGAVLFMFGRFLNKDEINHSFFFIPIEFWGVLAAVIGCVVPFVN